MDDKKLEEKKCEWFRNFDSHFNIGCVEETGERANGNFKGKEDGAKWEFKYCPYCGGRIQMIKEG